MKDEETDRYNNIKTKENYDLLINSGMFGEFYPELTWDWETDKKIMNSILTTYKAEI